MNIWQFIVLILTGAIPFCIYYLLDFEGTRSYRNGTTVIVATLAFCACIAIPAKREKIPVQPESVFIDSSYVVAVHNNIAITSNIANIVNNATTENVLIVRDRRINSLNFWIPSMSKVVIELKESTTQRKKQ